jgi:hypothetical protein
MRDRDPRAMNALTLTQYEVFCHMCGAAYLEQDPEVRFIYAEGVWECFDEAACFARMAVTGDG